MKRFFLFAVVCMGYMLTATSCLKNEIIDMPSNFNPSMIDSRGVEVTDEGITSYVVSNGRTYEVVLNNIVQQKQEKTDTLSVTFAQLKQNRLYNVSKRTRESVCR